MADDSGFQPFRRLLVRLDFMKNTNILDITKTTLKLKKMTLQERVVSSEEQLDASSDRNVVDIDITSTVVSDRDEISNNPSDFTFDNVIGHLEDMLIDEDFHRLQNSFLEKHWQEFDNSEENKHSYMTIFKEYTNEIEEFITKYLTERITNFDMEAFANELEERRDSLEGEIFEVLLTLSDFKAFKEILLDYREMKEGNAIDVGESLSVSSLPY